MQPIIARHAFTAHHRESCLQRSRPRVNATLSRAPSQTTVSLHCFTHGAKNWFSLTHVLRQSVHSIQTRIHPFSLCISVQRASKSQLCTSIEFRGSNFVFEACGRCGYNRLEDSSYVRCCRDRHPGSTSGCLLRIGKAFGYRAGPFSAATKNLNFAQLLLLGDEDQNTCSYGAVCKIPCCSDTGPRPAGLYFTHTDVQCRTVAGN